MCTVGIAYDRNTYGTDVGHVDEHSANGVRFWLGHGHWHRTFFKEKYKWGLESDRYRL